MLSTPNHTVAVSKPRGKRWAALAIGILLSIALPILAFQGVDVAQSWNLITGCSPLHLALGAFFFLFTLLARSLRWRYLLAAQQEVKARSCISATCVGFLANNILPFRLGNLVRVGALRQMEGGSAAKILGTVAVERVLDILTLVFFLGAYLAFAAGGPRQAELFLAGQLALAGAFFLVVVLVVGYWRRVLVQRLLAWPAHKISPKLGAKIGTLVGQVLEGLQIFASWRQVGKVLAFSLALWGGSVFQYYYVGQAIGLDLGPAQYMVVVFATAFGAIIPAAPGAVGTFHGFARLGLYLVAVHSGESALAFAAVLHLLEWLLMNGTGLYFLGRDGLTLLNVAPVGEPVETPRRIQWNLLLLPSRLEDSAQV